MYRDEEILQAQRSDPSLKEIIDYLEEELYRMMGNEQDD